MEDDSNSDVSLEEDDEEEEYAPKPKSKAKPAKKEAEEIPDMPMPDLPELPGLDAPLPDLPGRWNFLCRTVFENLIDKKLRSILRCILQNIHFIPLTKSIIIDEEEYRDCCFILSSWDCCRLQYAFAFMC